MEGKLKIKVQNAISTYTVCTYAIFCHFTCKTGELTFVKISLQSHFTQILSNTIFLDPKLAYCEGPLFIYLHIPIVHICSLGSVKGRVRVNCGHAELRHKLLLAVSSYHIDSILIANKHQKRPKERKKTKPAKVHLAIAFS